MSESLHGDQWPKGLTEEEVRTIAREESAKTLDALGEELATAPARADGTIGLDSFLTSLQIVFRKIKPGG